MIEIKLKDFKIAIDKVVTKIKKTQLEIFENVNTNVMDLYFYIGKIIYENKEYAILTNEIYKEWSGMKANEYKSFKGLRKESLRDNMSAVTNENNLTYKYVDDIKQINE